MRGLLFNNCDRELSILKMASYESIDTFCNRVHVFTKKNRFQFGKQLREAVTMTIETVKHYYRQPGLSDFMFTKILKQLKKFHSGVETVETEICFNVGLVDSLLPEDNKKLKWILSDPLSSDVSEKTLFFTQSQNQLLIEVGPRLNFSTPFSSNAVSIFRSVGLVQVNRIEKSIRYLISFVSSISDQQYLEFSEKAMHILCDRMTETKYAEPISTFVSGSKPEPWFEIDIMGDGKRALEKYNDEMGLQFDESFINFYDIMFRKKLKRNPTNVEIFDLAQSHSEHSRHMFFKGKCYVDGCLAPKSLFNLIRETQESSNHNGIISFCDNSSAIRGFSTKKLRPSSTIGPSDFREVPISSLLTLTAETHNFPTAVSPFSGAATGTGGRIRDIQAVGRGGNTQAGFVGYSVGNLIFDDYDLPWVDKSAIYPDTIAKPLDILIEGSNGCSDYGNKFGEPVILGFTRSFGAKTADSRRREYLKPILLSGGIGTMDEEHKRKELPAKSMVVAKIGGPAYRVGIGGGTASSARTQGDTKIDLDYQAVQRGDPEMEQKLNRFVRGCIEHDKNPIMSIHDQGAGGNGNVLKEMVEPSGAVIFTKAFELGDPTLSVLELWSAEYQENNALLCMKDRVQELRQLSHRERCPFNVVGRIMDTGNIVVTEENVDDCKLYGENFTFEKDRTYPVNLKLSLLEQKQLLYNLHSVQSISTPLNLSAELTALDALNRVLRHPTVCSKRFLTNKVDRSVTGLVAQQQCVGPLQTPLSDVAVTAINYFDQVGIATSIGEQPIKGLAKLSLAPRMTIAEALSNLVFAEISALADVKCSINWMWPQKYEGEGAAMYEVAEEILSLMKRLRIGALGGKDSLSMATRVGCTGDEKQDVVKAPGTVVVSTYVPCVDITKTVNPDLKAPRFGVCGSLLLVLTSKNKFRSGGSILAQCYGQVGDDPPDIDNAITLREAFKTLQYFVKTSKILSGHDISDGGLITCLTEMAIAGVSGFEVDLQTFSQHDWLDVLFAEECGWVIECHLENADDIKNVFVARDIPCYVIGKSKSYGVNSKVLITVGEEELLNVELKTLTAMWEETSYQLEKLQMNPDCADEEYKSIIDRKGPSYFHAEPFIVNVEQLITRTKVAVLREEGTNGDREMVAALHLSQFEVWDINMQDLLDGTITLDSFRGIVFPGGFSYGDVLGAAKGWAATIMCNEKLYRQFNMFYDRPDTFSFGVCNGCQLMCLINWVGINTETQSMKEPSIVMKENRSGRFESRFSTVKIFKSPSIMLKGLENSVLGVWVAHGEGRFTYASEEVEKQINACNCVPIRYVDDENEIAESYPFNPNGSKAGVAGICSKDGRHLAMMPHPERCVKFWQWPYIPLEWKATDVPNLKMCNSPWLKIFKNARKWCDENSE